MAKGLAFVIIPMIITLYLSFTLWHFTSSFPPMISVPKPTAAGPSAATPSAVKPNTITIPAGASVQGNPPYTPATLTVKKGDVITVTNADTAPHTSTSGSDPSAADNGKAWDTGLIMPGKSAKINTANIAPGEYPFHCTVHPYMKGTLTVKA